MTKEINFIALKDELCKAEVIFKNKDGLSNLYFNGYSNPNDFKRKLENLYLNFSTELCLNLSELAVTDSCLHYLELILKNFVRLEEKLGSNLTVVNSPLDISNKTDLDPAYICSKLSDVSDLVSYFCFQKNIILESIELIESYRVKYRRNTNEYWKDVFKDFFPHYCRMKEQLFEIDLIQDNIQFLTDQRKELELVFQEKGLNLFDSPFNLFFEFRIDCLKDLLIKSKLNQDLKPKLKEPALKWTGAKTDLIELVLSLDLLKVVELDNGSHISRKELFKRFELFFNLTPISDLDSRIHKLKSRSNKTSFLDQLKEYCNRFFNGEE